MVHLSKLLRHGGPTPYHPNPRKMVGSGSEVFNFNNHYYPLLPIHFVTIGGCIVCALYMARSLFFSSDVSLNKETAAYPWLIKSGQHQYKFFSFNLDYKELEDHPGRPKGFDIYKGKDKVVMTSKDYYKLAHGKKNEAEEEEEA